MISRRSIYCGTKSAASRFLAAAKLKRAAPQFWPWCALLLLFLTPTAALAQLTLTSAGVNAGYQLTTFASNFPNASNNGPLGMAFRGSGILVSDYPGNVRVFPTMTDGQNAISVTPAQNFGMANAEDIVRVNGQLYMTRRVQGDIVQLNEDGTFNQVIYSGIQGSPALIMCPTPVNGHLLVSTGICHKIWDVDPVARTASVWLDNLTAPGQMAFSEDGNVLYIALGTNPGNILGFDVVTKAVVFDYASLNPSTPLNRPAGIAVGSGNLARMLFINCEDGTVWSIDRWDGGATKIATGGSRGRCVKPVINRTLLLTQTDRIMRLIAPTGGAFAFSEPPSLTAVATGSDKIVLYWDGVQGALGYNVYRATVSGGQNYASPINGSTLVTALSFTGGSVYRYVDAGLATGVEYFYTVEALFPEGKSLPSNEDSDTPDPTAIPWDDPDPGTILSAVRTAYDTSSIPIYDSLRIVGPDGQAYEQTQATGPSTVSPPDGTWIRYTNQFRLSDGTYITLSSTPYDSPSAQSLFQLPASDGPYRRVRTQALFVGCSGTYHIPAQSEVSMAPNTRDQPYLMLGSSSDASANVQREVDAGLFLQRNHSGWTPWILSYPRRRVLTNFRSNQNPVDFPFGSNVFARYIARPIHSLSTPHRSYPALISLSTPDTTQRQTRGVYVGYGAETVRAKRTYSIAQGTRPYARTGSFLRYAQFRDGEVISYGNQPPDIWTDVVTNESGSSPAPGPIISWVELSQYDWDDSIIIDLR